MSTLKQKTWLFLSVFLSAFASGNVHAWLNSDTQLVQTQESAKEELVFKAPIGFVGYNAAGNDRFYTAEFVPSAEKKGPWKTKLILVAMRETPMRDPLEYNNKLFEDTKTYCPEAVLDVLSTGTENGNDYMITQMLCPMNANRKKSNLILRKSIKGKTIFMSVAYNFTEIPDEPSKAIALEYLKTVTLCQKIGGVCRP